MCHFLPLILVTRTTTTQKILDPVSMQHHSCDIFVSFALLIKHVGLGLFDRHMANRSRQWGMDWYRCVR